METLSYYKFTGPARLAKVAQSLYGILRGIDIDGRINASEVAWLDRWLDDTRSEHHLHPFNELVPKVKAALADGVLDFEDHEELSGLCQKLLEKEFYDSTTRDIQYLHGILAGILADHRINVSELRPLREWLDEHAHLMGRWPYDEVSSLLTGVLRDGEISDDEHALLTTFFSEFISHGDDRTLTAPPMIMRDGTVQGVCAVEPDVTFAGRRFCFTGQSNRYTRSSFHALVEQLGGSASNTVTRAVDYLVIGADGNPCWAYACYGRKVEAAVALRKQGHPLMIIHEHDFHDAVLDAR